jgi:hypothetical protein
MSLHKLEALLAIVVLGCSAPAGDDGVVESTDPSSSDGSSMSSTGDPATGEPETEDTATGDPATGDPATGDPETDEASTGSPDFPAEPCDMLAQDCPEGQKCARWLGFSLHSKCVPVLGDGQPGDPCTMNLQEGTDDCGPDSLCSANGAYDEPDTGICRPYCTGTLDDLQCPAGHVCIVRELTVTLSTLCERLCDPLASDCEAGLGCYFEFESQQETDGNFLCNSSSGNPPLGQPCPDGYPFACAPGDFCIEEYKLPTCDRSFCCTTYCDPMQGDAGCADVPGTTCQVYADANFLNLPQYPHVGACMAP